MSDGSFARIFNIFLALSVPSLFAIFLPGILLTCFSLVPHILAFFSPTARVCLSNPASALPDRQSWKTVRENFVLYTWLLPLGSWQTVFFFALGLASEVIGIDGGA